MIALITDFGVGSLYVGVMKAVIAVAAPHVPIIDITHDIAPHDIAAGSFALVRAFDYIPEGSVIVAVVDPGVGSERKRIAARIDGRTIVCPDNGLLADTLFGHPLEAAFVIEYPSPASATFEGRDIFAPIAARIACGASLGELGAPLPDPQNALARHSKVPSPIANGSRVTGHVREIDTFGNILTDIRPALLPPGTRRCLVTIGARPAALAPLVRTYADVGAGDLCVLTGSFGGFKTHPAR